MWRIIKDKTTAVQCIRLRYRTVPPHVSPREPHWIGHTSSRVGVSQRSGRWMRLNIRGKEVRTHLFAGQCPRSAIRLPWETWCRTRLRIRWQHKLTYKMCKTLQTGLECVSFSVCVVCKVVWSSKNNDHTQEVSRYPLWELCVTTDIPSLFLKLLDWLYHHQARHHHI